jgi:hypothetical protein
MPPDAVTSLAVALGDVDGDGDLDALIGNGGLREARNRLYLNDGAGHFADVTLSKLPREVDVTLSLALADVDGDGDLDALIGNLQQEPPPGDSEGEGAPPRPEPAPAPELPPDEGESPPPPEGPGPELPPRALLEDLPLHDDFAVPQFVGEGEGRTETMPAVGIEEGGGGTAGEPPPAGRTGAGGDEPPAEPEAEVFERALERALRSRHVPERDKPFVRSWFQRLIEGAR